jgi:hypothetical protein
MSIDTVADPLNLFMFSLFKKIDIKRPDFFDLVSEEVLGMFKNTETGNDEYTYKSVVYNGEYQGVKSEKNTLDYITK